MILTVSPSGEARTCTLPNGCFGVVAISGGLQEADEQEDECSSLLKTLVKRTKSPGSLYIKSSHRVLFLCICLCFP